MEKNLCYQPKEKGKNTGDFAIHRDDKPMNAQKKVWLKF